MKKLWSHSLVIKAFLTYLAVIGLLSTTFYFYSSTALKKLYVLTLGERMDREARLLSLTLPSDLEGAPLDTICRNLANQMGARITVIAASGRVLGDSAEPSSTMENHAARPEVVAAIALGHGSALRYSTTVGNELLYRAFFQSGEGGQRVIRVAVPLTNVDRATATLRQTLFYSLLGASGLGLFLAYVFARHLTRRVRRLVQFSHEIAAGTFPQILLPPSSPDEINLLERHLNDMSATLRNNIRHMITEKDKVESILRCMIEGVLVLTPKGQILLINDQAKAMFQVPSDRDIHGTSVLELFRHPAMRRMIDEVIAFDFSARSYRQEVELGEGRWFQVNASSLNDAQGKRLGSVLVFHDISEIKRLERVRSDFVANVSHELRTPLTSIRGYVETLLQTPPTNPKDVDQFLGIIGRHAERLTRLTEDLLTLSDLESGKLRLQFGPVDANQLIQRVLEIFWDQANKKGVMLGHHVEPALAPILGDFDRLQQLLINLVDNAVKYTPPGGRIAIEARRALPASGRQRTVEILIIDTGPGIPPHDLPRLTERFYRADKARSRELGGAGLGLAIVKHIAQAHKAELKIESAVQKGTTVRVRIPAVMSDCDATGILFLCTANSCRSQMAEGFAKRFAPNNCVVYSAGTNPRGVHPRAIQVMQEIGIDITAQLSKGLDAVPMDYIDLLITLCADAAEHCPVLPQPIKRLHWPLRDPAATQGTPEEVLNVFREIRDEIQDQVRELLATPLEAMQPEGN